MKLTGKVKHTQQFLESEDLLPVVCKGVGATQVSLKGMYISQEENSFDMPLHDQKPSPSNFQRNLRMGVTGLIVLRN